MPFVPSSFLFLVVRPGAPSSNLAPSSLHTKPIPMIRRTAQASQPPYAVIPEANLAELCSGGGRPVRMNPTTNQNQEL